MSELGEDVRERSPLHEVGERDWPRDEEKDRFRMRLRRNTRTGGATGRTPVRVINGKSVTKPRGSTPSSPPRGSNPSSPDLLRRPSAERSPNLSRNRTPVRPSRLPVVSVYGGKPSSPVFDPKHGRPRKSSADLSSTSTAPNTPCQAVGRLFGGVVEPGPARYSPAEVRRTCSPKRGDVSRRVPSPTLPIWRRSPSNSRSRPSSPGIRPPSPGGRRAPSPGARRGSRPPSPRGSTKRNPSPSQLDPQQAEVVRRRVGQLSKVRLYLLQQVGSNSFLVAGESTQFKYKVNIGPQTCSCMKGPGCLHLLFIMLRVLKITENDSRLTAKVLKEYETESLFRCYEERKKTRVLRSRQHSVEQLMAESPEEDDAVCPICLSEMEAEEGLTQCAGCSNNLHRPCMAVWIDECQSQGETVLCPLCRSPWDFAKCEPKPTPSAAAGHFQYFSPSPYTKQRPAVGSLASSGYSSVVSRTSDTLHMIEQNGCPEDIPLPKAEPIPQQHWPVASGWINVYGRDLVACLFSRDWVKRETGLRRLAREVVRILQTSGPGEYSEKVDRGWKCCVEVLQLLLEDKVYKVYLAGVKTLRALLNFLRCTDEAQLQQVKLSIRPLFQSILVKCADGNKRISEVSTDTLLEVSRGSDGDMAIGKHSSCSPGYSGLDHLLNIILEERDLQSVTWQWIMGRLCLLEKMLDQFPGEFSLETNHAHTNFNRLMMIIDFSFQNLTSSHTNVSRLAKKVFTLAARNTAVDNTTFNQVWQLLGALDSTLEMRMRKNITAAVEQMNCGGEPRSTSSSCTSSSSFRSPQEQDRSAFLESFLNECSNQHTEYVLGKSVNLRKKSWRPPLMRSTSHSPSRQMPPTSRSASQSPSRLFSTKKNSLCQSVYNVSSAAAASSSSSKRPIVLSKARGVTRLAQKTKVPDLGREVLPKFDLSFLSGGSFSEAMDLDLTESMELEERLVKPCQQRPTTSGKRDGQCRSPPTKSRCFKDSGLGCRSPLSSPMLGQKRSGSCKDLMNFEESMALALALSKSIYHETPLPHIPGLSQKVNQDVIAHPHKQILEGSDERRDYQEGRDWTKGVVLGTGAYSTCYQARDVETGTIMAAKQISFCRNSEEEQEKVEQLVREEVTLMSRLHHPHTVRMYGAIQEGNHINVFEEWMPGGSISSLLDRHGAFTEQVILRYTHQILLGLDYLHSHGILHRDLKGANLLVDTSGHHLRIADFGAAARMLSKTTIPGEFQGDLQGTIAFMAPEVLRGDSYGRACDIWSLGCTIIEMGTAKPPWGAADVSNHLTLIFMIACAASPPTVPDNLSPALRDLTLRCLELDPNLRPTARELLLHPALQQGT